MTREADKAEAEAAALDAELEVAEAEALAEEAAADQAEQKLTTSSAAVLAEYAAKHAETEALEKELESTRASLEAVRAENLRRLRQSLDLDKEDNACLEEIGEAEALLQKCMRSHGELDAEIAKRREDCEVEREAHRCQAERLEADIERFEKSKARLLEVQAIRPGEANSLIEEADAMIKTFRQALLECQQVVRNGVAPASSLAAEPAPAAQAVRPRRWRAQPPVDAVDAAAGAPLPEPAAQQPAEACAPCAPSTTLAMTPDTARQDWKEELEAW